MTFFQAFEKALLLVGDIEPDTEYNQNRNAPARQKVDPVTGLRQWKATCTDPSESNPKRSSVQVIFLADVAPIPHGAELISGTGLRVIELENMTLQPKVTGQGEFKTLGWTIRATGIKGDTSGAKQAPADPGAARPSTKAA
ncbi:hypothetical protein AB0H76_26225 [Nocardia sp. NPDC050712]|uniref:hypothetical protein n=1 Tax=Nocardia sp. NPDC050712 TaxID=3155518 RepID=UPI0033E30CE9